MINLLLLWVALCVIHIAGWHFATKYFLDGVRGFVALLVIIATGGMLLLLTIHIVIELVALMPN